MKDVIIIGGGPAGMSAALNLLRSGKSVLILEKNNFGGQIANSPRVENLPSIKEISGADFASEFFDQVTALGAEFELEEVLEVKKVGNTFKVKTNYNSYESKAVIIATGVKHKKFNIPNEAELEGKGISYCAVCDGAFYKGKDVYLIGDANTALQYALMLSKTSAHVYMFTLFDKFFGDKILVDRLLATENISVTHNMNLIEYIGDEELSGLKFENTQTHEIKQFTTDNVFVAIGQVPHNEFLNGFVDLEKGFIVTNEKMETKTPGVFASGDCTFKEVKQVVTACNDGAIAATMALRYLDK